MNDMKETNQSPPRRGSSLLNAWIAKNFLIVQIAGILAVAAGVSYYFYDQTGYAADAGQFGGPVAGLTPDQVRKFYAAKALFKKEFTMEEGLGPLFNGKSCYECHGQPSFVGAEGRDISSTSIINFSKRVHGSEKAQKPLREVIEGLRRIDVDAYLTQGGPTLQRKSLSTENPDKFPFDAQVDFEQIPVDAELQSNRHTPPIFGDGFIDQVSAGDILYNEMRQTSNAPALAGRSVPQIDRFLERPDSGRFGWKDQINNLLNFTATALNTELGITTYVQHTENTPTYLGILPIAFRNVLPRTEGPNDKGKLLVALTYFQSLLAPPPRGPITPQVKKGEEVFTKLQCAVCHIPELRTADEALVPDPDSPIPKINYMRIDAMSKKKFYPYTDLLVHQMGPDLADGIPQEGAKGGEWRTTPLWGLRIKKFLLHDGRTTSLHEAIMAHGGQAESVKKEYAVISKEDRDALHAFLRSL
jgi:CxxC motif-containing protein (DUF1111 family)